MSEEYTENNQLQLQGESQTIVRVSKNQNYTVIFNEVARRADLSARCKGLFYYLMTLPDNWQIYQSEICQHFTEGRDAMNKAFKELENAGYIKKKTRHGKDGRLDGWEYTVIESVENLQSTDTLKNRMTEKPHAVNPQLASTDSLANINSSNAKAPANAALVDNLPEESSESEILEALETYGIKGTYRIKSVIQDLKGQGIDPIRFFQFLHKSKPDARAPLLATMAGEEKWTKAFLETNKPQPQAVQCPVCKAEIKQGADCHKCFATAEEQKDPLKYVTDLQEPLRRKFPDIYALWEKTLEDAGLIETQESWAEDLIGTLQQVKAAAHE